LIFSVYFLLDFLDLTYSISKAITVLAAIEDIYHVGLSLNSGALNILGISHVDTGIQIIARQKTLITYVLFIIFRFH